MCVCAGVHIFREESEATCEEKKGLRGCFFSSAPSSPSLCKLLAEVKQKTNRKTKHPRKGTHAHSRAKHENPLPLPKKVAAAMTVSAHGHARLTFPVSACCMRGILMSEGCCCCAFACVCVCARVCVIERVRPVPTSPAGDLSGPWARGSFSTTRRCRPTPFSAPFSLYCPTRLVVSACFCVPFCLPACRVLCISSRFFVCVVV